MRGSITIIILLSIVIIGSIMLVGGAYPIISYDTLNFENQKTFDEDQQPTPTGKQNNKQLQIQELKNCSDSLAVEFLLDTSGSMEDGGKMDKLKEALNNFISKVKNKSVIAIRTFNTVTSMQVGFDFYKNNQLQVQAVINGLSPGGGTYTRNAFAGVKEDIVPLLNDKKFQMYTPNIIFFSDGIPETSAANTACVSRRLCTDKIVSPIFPGECRCFDTNQDPTNKGLSDGDIVEQIKKFKNKDGKNVNIFSVLLFNKTSDAFFETEEEALMQRIASAPENFYKTPRADDLQKIFNQIITQVCN